jgi:segregation and condensation protein A
MERASLYKHHEISREPLSVRERMTHILSRIQQGPATLDELVDPEEGRLGVVVCFLAILEMARSAMLDIEQDSPFAPLMVMPPRPRAAPVEESEGADA